MGRAGPLYDLYVIFEINSTYVLKRVVTVNRPGKPGGTDLHWVLLPFRLLKLSLSKKLNSWQRPIPRSFDDEQ
jgi:hypothetical protein